MAKATAKRRKKIDTACRKIAFDRMFERGVSCVQIAMECGTDKSQVTRVLDGTRHSLPVKRILSHRLNLDEDILFARKSKRQAG